MLGSTLMVNAQSGTNSPYSQYGLGVLSDQTSGFNRGMNGVGLGFHEHNQVNYLNPASYSAIDSMTFILDAGISGQVTNFNEKGVKKNANNSNLEYVVAGFRLFRNVGMSFGIVPFTNVGYNYVGSTKDLDLIKETASVEYEGSGGFHQAYLGLGWSPVRNLSLGANLSYLWGNIERDLVLSFTTSSYSTLSRTYTVSVNSYKVDLGLQYTLDLGKKDALTLGLTFSPKHNLGGNADMSVISTRTVSDTASYSIDKAYSIPNMYGIGLMWNHNGQWKIGLDYSLQKWGELGYPLFDNRNSIYELKSDVYMDRSKFNLGFQYCYAENGRASFLKRVHYRAGVSYATPYYKVNGVDGPKEISVSAGFGIPIMNGYNNRSQLNISGQWVKSSAKDLIKENSFRINIGFTFNEDWFKKWKMQ